MRAWRRCRSRVPGPLIRSSSAVAGTASRVKLLTKLERDPDITVAQTAVDVVQQVEGNAREREHQAALAAQEAEQSAIEHQNPGEGGRSEAEQLGAKWRQEDE